MTQTARKIDEEAARWAVRLAVGPLSPDEQRELDAWLSNGLRQRGALVRAQATWVDLDRLAVLAAGVRTGSPVQSSRRDRRQFFLAASVVLCVLAGAVGGWFAWQARGMTFASEIGQQREVKLADGSQMVLNTASKANVRVDEGRREIRVIDGEVLFDVAKDPTRPFVVHAGHLTVTALGTAFAVRRNGERVDVTVTEGVVEIVHDNAGSAIPRRRMVANQLAVATESQVVDVRTLPHQETERRLAWRSGMVVFNGEPLSEAVAEMNRHSKRRIVIADPQLAARPVVGIFRASDTETFVSAATAVLNAQAVDAGEAIELRARSTP
jgi:transmembrane sensor